MDGVSIDETVPGPKLDGLHQKLKQMVSLMLHGSPIQDS